MIINDQTQKVPLTSTSSSSFSSFKGSSLMRNVDTPNMSPSQQEKDKSSTKSTNKVPYQSHFTPGKFLAGDSLVQNTIPKNPSQEGGVFCCIEPLRAEPLTPFVRRNFLSTINVQEYPEYPRILQRSEASGSPSLHSASQIIRKPFEFDLTVAEVLQQLCNEQNINPHLKNHGLFLPPSISGASGRFLEPSKPFISTSIGCSTVLEFRKINQMNIDAGEVRNNEAHVFGEVINVLVSPDVFSSGILLGNSSSSGAKNGDAKENLIVNQTRTVTIRFDQDTQISQAKAQVLSLVLQQIQNDPSVSLSPGLAAVSHLFSSSSSSSGLSSSSSALNAQKRLLLLEEFGLFLRNGPNDLVHLLDDRSFASYCLSEKVLFLSLRLFIFPSFSSPFFFFIFFIFFIFKIGSNQRNKSRVWR